MNIKFIRVLRECGHNQTLKERGESRGLIYDFDIMVDGVKRGEWRRGFTKGYYLADRSGISVRTALFSGDIKQVPSIGSQNKMLDYTLDLLTLLPTEEQIAERDRLGKEKADAESRAKVELARVNRIKEAGPELLALLIEARAELGKRVGEFGSDWDGAAMLIRMDDVISKATGSAS